MKYKNDWILNHGLRLMESGSIGLNTAVIDGTKRKSTIWWALFTSVYSYVSSLIHWTTISCYMHFSPRNPNHILGPIEFGLCAVRFQYFYCILNHDALVCRVCVAACVWVLEDTATRTQTPVRLPPGHVTKANPAILITNPSSNNTALLSSSRRIITTAAAASPTCRGEWNTGHSGYGCSCDAGRIQV